MIRILLLVTSADPQFYDKCAPRRVRKRYSLAAWVEGCVETDAARTLLVTSQVESRKPDIADREFLRSCVLHVSSPGYIYTGGIMLLARPATHWGGG